MNPSKHPSHNHVLEAPRGWDQSALPCEPLHVRLEMTPGHILLQTSHWRPPPEELASLNSGGYVTLTLLSHRHPPVMVGVEA